jgi:hypothetical protein
MTEATAVAANADSATTTASLRPGRNPSSAKSKVAAPTTME